MSEEYTVATEEELEYEATIATLRAQNAVLLAALEANALRAHRWDSGHECNNQRFDDCHTIDCVAARAAIAKAKAQHSSD